MTRSQLLQLRRRNVCRLAPECLEERAMMAGDISIGDADVVEGAAEYRFTDNFVAPDAYGLAAARDLVAGPDGNIYVASADNDVVKVFQSETGQFLRNLSTPGGELDGPTGMTFGADGMLYVGGKYSRNVVRFDITNGAASEFVPTGTGGQNGVRALAFGPDGNLYVSGKVVLDPTMPVEVKKYDGATGAFLSDVISESTDILSVSEVAFGPDGNLYMAASTSREILRYDGQTGAFIGVFATIPPQMGNPTQFLFHTDGLLYVNESGNSRIDRYDAITGAFVDTFVSGTSTRTPDGFAFTSSGELFVSSGSVELSPGSHVERFAPNSTAAFNVTLPAASTSPVTVDFATASGSATASSDFVSASGSLTFSPGETSRTILVRTLDDAALEGNETFVVNLSNPSGAAIADGQGIGTIIDNEVPPTKFFVVDDASFNKTYEYAAAGSAIENYNLNSGNAAPRGAASTASGDKVWVVDNNRNVYVYDNSGGLLGSWTAGTLASNAQPQGIATNGSDVWIVDARSDKVFKYTGAATRLSGSQSAASSFNLASGNGAPSDIVTDGGSFWVTNDASTNRVYKYTLTGASLGNWTIDAANATPTGITIDPSNVSDIWIVDAGTDRVYTYAGAASRTSGSQSAASSFALASGNANPQGIADPPVATSDTVERNSFRSSLSGSAEVKPEEKRNEFRFTLPLEAVDQILQALPTSSRAANMAPSPLPPTTPISFYPSSQAIDDAREKLADLLFAIADDWK